MSAERRVLSLVLTGLLLIAAVAMVSWFFTHFERRTEQIPVGYSAEARRNPLLAAERFLDRLDVPVESSSGRDLLRTPPPPTDTLVVLGLGPMSAEGRRRLSTWLEQGGHLVVEAMRTREEAAADDFLSELGIQLVVEDADEDGDPEVIARIVNGHPDRPARVAFLAGYWLEARAGDRDLVVVAGDRLRVVQRTVGQGLLTVLSDSRFMTNTAIGEHDHAYFLARLVSPEGDGKVWLLHDSAVPWLGALLWSIAPHALVSAGLAILVWLWSLGRRLGPLTGVPQCQRRDLIEHLDASGAFLWRHARAGHLVETSRQHSLSDWLRRHPDIAHADTHTLAARIAEITGESVDSVYSVLFTQPADERGFIEQAQLLQTLRRSARGSTFAPRASRRLG